MVLDGQSGEALRTWPLELAGFVRAVNDKLVYVITDNSNVVAVNPETGETRPLITGLTNARCLAVDGTGRIYVSTAEPNQQVLVFSPEGKELGRIGRPGGRSAAGPLSSRRHALSVRAGGRPARQTVGHGAQIHPKRVSVWDLKDGKLVKEFFGPCHYGASGGAVNPRNPNLMVGEGCEWRIDPITGRDKCLGTFDRRIHGFACFRPAVNGRLYLVTTTAEEFRPGGSIRIFERLGDGQFKLHAEFRPGPKLDNGRPKTTILWTDANGNGREDASELQESDGWSNFTGSNHWSINVGLDLTLYGFNVQAGRLEQFRVAGFSPSGARNIASRIASCCPLNFRKVTGTV